MGGPIHNSLSRPINIMGALAIERMRNMVNADRTGVRRYVNNVDLVLVACLIFREFLIVRLFTKVRIREF